MAEHDTAMLYAADLCISLILQVEVRAALNGNGLADIAQFIS
jgi:hypothetical protein